jgi:tetratricopeptide (TPR) repeat protein
MGAGRRAEWDYVQGVELLNLGKIPEASAALGRAFRDRPESDRFALGYGQSLFLAGRYQDAKDVLQPFAGQEGVAPDILSYLGRACHALGQYREAISFYQDYLNKAGTSVEILNFIGTCHYQLGERDEALAAWKRSLEISPDQAKLKALVESLEKK